MKTLQLISFLFPLLLLFGCEQYLGYKYDVQEPDNSVAISGTIQNTFTGEKVDSALIQIGDQKTYSDAFGEFRIIHTIETDDERNKPVTILVTAENYLPYSNHFLIYHEDIQSSISLDYAAPVIDSSFVYYDSITKNIICHTFITDYQGGYDIRLVKGSFFYEKEGEHIYKQFDIPLTYHTYLSNVSAEFTCFVPGTIGNGWMLLSRGFFYYIYAEDYEGYSVRVRLK